MNLNSTPTVSVITPTYNRADLIGESVESVLSQTFTDLELIIVDDGSTDNTLELLGNYEAERVTVISQDNHGMSHAWNTGIGKSTGRFLTFNDSDDCLLPHMLETLLSALENSPEAGLAYARSQGINGQGDLLTRFAGVRERFPGYTYKSMLYGDLNCKPTAVVRRKCFDRVGLFDESLFGRTDWDMFLRVARYYPFVYIDKVLARFRFHEDRTTGPKSKLHIPIFLNGLTVLDKAYAEPDLPPEALEIKAIAYRNVHMNIGIHWLRLGRYREAVSSFSSAITASGSPVSTTARIIFRFLNYTIFSKTVSGYRLVNWLVKIRTSFEGRTRNSPK